MIEISFYFVLFAAGISFYACFMGGANDFANAFGTSVGSGAINIRKAVIIAICAEFLGATLVGGHVTDTIRKGIIDTTNYEANPMQLAYGLLAALIGSGLFIQLSTQFGMPVSTTHAIVGAVVGFGIVSMGVEGVLWNKVIWIAFSWVLSPLGGGIIAYLTFRIIQKKVLENEQPLRAASKTVPWFVAVTTVIVMLSILYKGLKNLHLDFPLLPALGISGVLGLIAALVVRNQIKRIEPEARRIQVLRVEGSFKLLQIITAGYVAFAHGANDVANGIGPLAGIWSIYQSGGVIGMQAVVPFWILFLGGTGIICGLAFMGYKVIETIGTRITEITPSRGFAAEFSTATVVLLFSKLGMPVSTTHTIVGAVVGVGMARGIDALDLRVVFKIISTWFVTIPLAAATTILSYYVIVWIL